MIMDNGPSPFTFSNIQLPGISAGKTSKAKSYALGV
jgi:hypothetical protein